MISILNPKYHSRHHGIYGQSQISLQTSWYLWSIPNITPDIMMSMVISKYHTRHHDIYGYSQNLTGHHDVYDQSQKVIIFLKCSERWILKNAVSERLCTDSRQIYYYQLDVCNYVHVCFCCCFSEDATIK